MLTVSVDFESGNFLCDLLTEKLTVGRIRKDANHKDCQWFMFAVDNPKNTDFEVILTELDKTSFPSAWDTFQASILYEGGKWHLANTQKEENSIRIRVKGSKKRVLIAYARPFSMVEHKLLTQRLGKHKLLTKIHESTTQDRNKIQAFSFGNKIQRKNLWIIARQHPGETIVGPFMMGLVDVFEYQKLTIEKILNKYNIHIIHNMNPDGVVSGMHRTNSIGSDLNRDWLNPQEDCSPELIFVRNLMDRFPPSIFLDIHGDERIINPYVNVDKSTLNVQDRTALETIISSLKELEIRDSETVNHDLNIARHYVNYKYQCLCMTVEMPCQGQLGFLSTKRDYFNSAKELAKSMLGTLELTL